MGKQKRVFSKEEIAEICRLYVEEKSPQKKISKMFNVGEPTIKDVLKIMGSRF